MGTEDNGLAHTLEVQPREPQRRRGPLLWIKRGLLGLGIGLIALAVIGAIYQAIATEIDQRTYPPPGKMVDVNGHLLHINCMGEGSPTVIFESGLGGMSTAWANIQPQVAKTTRACAYDRAGIGWSEPGPTPRDPKQIAHELHTLLGKAGIDGPYVLVGQSFGGLYVRMYADMYPNEVAGMVLVDSSHPDMWTRLPPEAVATLKFPAWQARAVTFLTRLGVFRLAGGGPLLTGCGGLPVRQCKESQAFEATARYAVTWRQEYYERNRDAQVRATRDLGDKPLVVLTAGDHSRDFAGGLSPAERTRFERSWYNLQSELAALSTDSVHLVVEGAGHSTLQTDQEDAQETIAAILRVVKAVRTGQSLTR